MKENLEELIDEYKRRLNSIICIMNLKEGYISDSTDSTYHRLIGKKEIYKLIITELEKIFNGKDD